MVIVRPIQNYKLCKRKTKGNIYIYIYIRVINDIFITNKSNCRITNAENTISRRG